MCVFIVVFFGKVNRLTKFSLFFYLVGTDSNTRCALVKWLNLYL